MHLYQTNFKLIFQIKMKEFYQQLNKGRQISNINHSYFKKEIGKILKLRERDRIGMDAKITFTN